MKSHGRSPKTVLAVFFALLLIISAAACSAQPKPAEANTADPLRSDWGPDSPGYPYEPEGSTPGQLVSYRNGVSLEFDQLDGTFDPKPGSARLTGLKDKSVSEAICKVINEELAVFYEDDYEPDFPGIKALEKRYGESGYNTYTYCSDIGQIDNILSVLISYSRYYGNVYARGDQITVRRGLNFDLSTGKQLSLQDLFIDGVDAKKYVNAQIYKQVLASDPSMERSADEWTFYIDSGFPALMRPFQGIKDDQDFYIGYDGSLYVVLDGRNSEFRINEGSYPVGINIGSVSAMGSRFGGEKHLYEEEMVRFLLPSEITRAIYSGFDSYGSRDVESEILKNSDLSYYISYITYNSLPDYCNSFLSMERLDITGMLENAAKRLEGYKREIPGIVQGYVYGNSNAQRYGDYISMSASLNEDYNTTHKGGFAHVYHSWAECRLAGSEKLLGFEDIFVPGSDWKKHLKNAVISAAKEEWLAGRIDVSDPAFLEMIDAMIERLSGFCLEGENMFLSYSDYSPISGNSDDYWMYENLFSRISYRYIGYDNLVMFR